MRVLIGCEFSGRVRDAFIRAGHDAISCDLRPSDRPGPHLQGNVLDYLEERWDMLIAFPSCRFLTNAGVHWLKGNPERRWLRKRAVEFVKLLADADIPKIAIENPIGHLSTAWRKPDQIIHPWQFGHPETKQTCLWLKNLPLLQPQTDLSNGFLEERIWRMKPGKNRSKDRSETYQGIADAMALQWGQEQQPLSSPALHKAA